MTVSEKKKIVRQHPEIKKMNNKFMVISFLWLGSIILAPYFIPLVIIAIVMPFISIVLVHKYNKRFKELMKIVDQYDGDVDWDYVLPQKRDMYTSPRSNPVAGAAASYVVGRAVNDSPPKSSYRKKNTEYSKYQKVCANCVYYSGSRIVENGKVIITEEMRNQRGNCIYFNTKPVKKCSDGMYCTFHESIL